MKSKRTKKRRANQARSAEHQQVVLGLRSSSAASKHTSNVPRREERRRALNDQE
jgi:hypothetical protein